MANLSQKKVGKLIGLKKSDFNDLIKAKEITLRKPRLIPIYKFGDELALTSVLLSSLRLIKEFRQKLFSESKMQIGGSIFVYTEIEFKDFPESRVDGLILVVKAGTIRDAAIIEVKNGKNELDKDQLERYQKIAKNYSIPKFLTISNQFVSDSTQSPVNLKSIRGLDLYHFSWSYLLTIAHVLLFNNDDNITDEDQIEIMREVVSYLEWDKSGVFGNNQMSQGWVDTVEKVNSGANLKISDKNVFDTVLSWQQEEQDMALILSRVLGVLVSSGQIKHKGKLDERLKSDCKTLVNDKELHSTLKVKDAISDIKVISKFEKRTVEMIISLKPPADKTYKGQLGWIKRQLDMCGKREKYLFEQISKELFIDVLIKKSPISERFSIFEFDKMTVDLKDKEIREFNIIYIKDFGKKFSSSRKFVEMIEDMLKCYYKGIIQFLTKWEPSAPKVINKQEQSGDDDHFIDAVNSNEIISTTEDIDSNENQVNDRPNEEII
jgi:hypothetical protein